MIFAEMLKSCNKEELLKYMEEIDKRNSPEVYEKLLNKLLQITPKDSDFTIHVKRVKDVDGEEYTDVFGKSQNDSNSYALEFTPWNLWLGSETDQESVNTYGNVAFVGECLYEMSFVSFDEDEIQKELDEMKKAIEEFKAQNQ